MKKPYHPTCERNGVCQGLQKLGSDANFARPMAGPAGAPLRGAANLDSDPKFCFAPGVIQGPDLPIEFMDDDDAPLLPLTLADAVWLLATVAVLGFVAGWLVERLL